MKATPAEQNELLRLQSIDTDLQRLEHAARNLPQDAELKSLAPQFAAVRQTHVAQSGELEDARTELRRVESDVAVVEARIERDAGRLEHSASVKDIQGLEAELTSLRKRRFDLEEIELSVMERIEQLEGTLAEVEGQRSELGDRMAGLEAGRRAELESLDVKRKALVADRATIAGTLPGDLVALYEKQRARYGTGAALLQRGISLGSNTALNPTDMDAIRKSAPDDVLLCPESSCILVRNEESGL